MDRRPYASILDVASEFLEAECPIRPGEQIDTAIMFVVFDAVEDETGFVEAPGYPTLSSQNPLASSAFSSSAI
jgi:hypothetical protein